MTFDKVVTNIKRVPFFLSDTRQLNGRPHNVGSRSQHLCLLFVLFVDCLPSCVYCIDLQFSGYAVRYLRPNVTQAWKVLIEFVKRGFHPTQRTQWTQESIVGLTNAMNARKVRNKRSWRNGQNAVIEAVVASVPSAAFIALRPSRCLSCVRCVGWKPGFVLNTTRVAKRKSLKHIMPFLFQNSLCIVRAHCRRD